TIHDALIDLRDLKREVELAAGLERSTPPTSRSTEIPAQTILHTVVDAAGSSTNPAAVAHPTSSAEYVASEIKRHKSVVVIISAVIIVAVVIGLSLAGLGLYKYLTQSATPRT